jgi:hypothetical protein
MGSGETEQGKGTSVKDEGSLIERLDEMHFDAKCSMGHYWRARSVGEPCPACAAGFPAFTTSDGRPIFGEVSPHDLEEHLDRICAKQTLPFGWRWHFRMSRLGQRTLRLAHRQGTPRWVHDLIEWVLYGRRS